MPWLGGEPDQLSAHHVQVFVPSVDREGQPIPRGQEYWVEECLRIMGSNFGGATALPPARGVWRDDEAGGELLYDNTVVVFSYVTEEDLTGQAGVQLYEFLMRLGREGAQGEVGLFVDGRYYGYRTFDTDQTSGSEAS